MDIEALAPWLHNVHLPDGRQTAPDHALGDWPRKLWRSFSHAFADDLTGVRVLDIGCNAGFYSFEMAKRGAQVTGIDVNRRYLRQAEALARELELEDRTTFRQAQVYDLASWRETFDIVLFLGVFYHLRYPVLGLDLAARRCSGQFVFQSLMHGPAGDGKVQAPDASVGDDLSFLSRPEWPSMAFVEGSLFGDPTNWWVPQANAVPPLLRAAGLRVDEVAAGHVFLCEVAADAPESWQRWEGELAAATGDRGATSALEMAPLRGTLETTPRR